MKNIENGVYILSVSNSLIPAAEISKHVFEKGHEPQFVVLVTDYCAIKIDKNIENPMTYSEAIKFDLPDTIQGHLIGLNRDILKPAIEAIGGTWTDGWYWCKTEYNSNNAWAYNGINGNLDNYYKDGSSYVRPVTAFQLQDLSFEAPKETKTSKKSNKSTMVGSGFNASDLGLERLKLSLSESILSTLANPDPAVASLIARNVIDSNKTLFLTLSDSINESKSI